MPPTLSVTALERSFRGVDAVKGISFSVAPGQILGLLGPNGSGKSTTMKLCAGVIRPTAGEVLVSGISMTSSPAAAKHHVGFVPDVGGLFPRLTGWEHLELAARLFGVPQWRRRAEDLMASLDLTDAAPRRAATYSHGMSRKLSVAIALLPSPDLLLLDEPFDGVDPTGAGAVELLAQEAALNDTAVLVTTHLLDVAERLCDDVLVMRRGDFVLPPTSTASARGTTTLEEAYKELLRA